MATAYWLSQAIYVCGLLDRFLLDQKQEQKAEQITHNTLASYRSMICQHIRPKWGDAYLEAVLANVSRPFYSPGLFWTGLSVPFKQRRHFV
jgi:hypothetical protein